MLNRRRVVWDGWLVVGWKGLDKMQVKDALPMDGMWREKERKRDEGRNIYKTHILARLPLVTSCQAGIEVGRKALRNP
jgi:hypothetical protein